MDEMFSTYTQDNTTQFLTLKLRQPYRKTLKGQKGLSYLCGIKSTQNVNQ